MCSQAFTRRRILSKGLAAAAAVAMPTIGSAQTQWPSKPIRLVVPSATGGSNDIFARALGAKISARLGQPIVVENKVGAGTVIGTDMVAKAAPDGHTLLITSVSLTTNAAIGKKLPYDPVKDLQPIGLIGTTPLIVVVAANHKAKTFADLMSIAREKDGGMFYASPGIGSINHLATEYLASEAKVKLTHVPYGGATPALTDLVAGSVEAMLSSPASAASMLQAGKIRAIAGTARQRSPFMPELPTVAETFVPGFNLESWWGLFGPAKMPANVLKRLNEELRWALAQADIRELLAREGATAKPSSPEELGELVSVELERWSMLIKKNNIKME